MPNLSAVHDLIETAFENGYTVKLDDVVVEASEVVHMNKSDDGYEGTVLKLTTLDPKTEFVSYIFTEVSSINSEQIELTGYEFPDGEFGEWENTGDESNFVTFHKVTKQYEQIKIGQVDEQV
jgi:hypothetical protein